MIQTKEKIVTFLVVATLIVVLAVLIQRDPHPMTISQTCSFERGDTRDIYTCRSPDGCWAWVGNVSCSEMQEVPKVLARTNKDFRVASSLTQSDAWLALDLGGAGLVGFKKTSSIPMGSCNRMITFSIVLPSGITLYGNGNEVYKKNKEVDHNYCIDKNYYFIQSSDSAINTNNNFLSTDVAGVNVIRAPTSGNAYNCKFSYTIQKNTGSEVRYLEYAKDTPGNVNLSESQAIALNQGDSIFLGFDAVLYYKEKVCTVCECTANQCYGTAVWKCENIDPLTGCGKLTTTEACPPGQQCVRGECVVPYRLFIDLQDNYGANIDTFKPNEKVYVKMFLDSKIEETGTIFFDLYKDGSNTPVLQRQRTISLPMKPGEFVYIDFGTLGLGNYVLKTRYKTFDTTNSFSVSDELVVSSSFGDKTRFTTNQDILITIDVSDSIPDFNNNIKVTAKLDDQPVTYTAREVQAGEYEYTFRFDRIGQFSAEFEVTRPGYPTAKTSRSRFIDEPTLSITTLFSEIIATGEHKLDFDVKDEFGNYITPDVLTIKMIDGSTGKTEMASSRDISGSAGQFSYTYKFGEGTFKMEIYANKDGYSARTSETWFNIVDVRPDKPSTPGIGINWSTILLISFPLAFILIFVLLIWWRRNRW